MVCLQLRLPNNLSTPARLGAGVGSLEDVTALRLMGRYGKLLLYRQGLVTLVTVSCPSLWKWDPLCCPGKAAHQAGQQSTPALSLQPGCAQLGSLPILEQSAGLATASSRKALGSASSPCSYVHWVF